MGREAAMRLSKHGSGWIALARCWLPAGLIAAAGLLSPAARADDDTPTVMARSFATIPPGVAMSVEPRDDSDENLRLRDAIATQLTARRQTVAADGPLRLRFSTERFTEYTLTRAPEPRDQMNGPVGHLPMIQDDYGTELPNRTYGALPARRQRSGAVQYELRATLEGRADAKVFWRGKAIGETRLNEVDLRMLGGMLAEALVAKLGQTYEPVAPDP
jgi:hypothetical protein